MRRTTYNNVRAAQALAPSTARTDGAVNGATIDRFVNDVYYRSVTFVINAGTVTDGTHTVAVEDSDNGSVWGAAAAADVQGTAPAVGTANDERAHEVGYVGPKRYVRITLTTAGATTGGLIDAVAILGVQPVKR
ncbi:hypothetical protein E1264_11745 [Actinomadura sp. KC216]|uniref:hypothetical protein n=1 Tax=Actinomadura sp. KC216 TaxID=2530370 RepID=UPI00105104C7|nr:hypothetical protein [Actinomadura sp. KC216]TDB88348.1 hypothetical protein E1264_11745 [Actinomadura sp. KC216]